MPDAEGIRQIELKVPLRVYSSDGVLISEFGSERRIPIDYSETPKTLIDAVLASEDDNFFNHFGVDFTGLIRAALANFSSGRAGQGASTITMQVARNFYLSPEKTYSRKIKEILLSLRLEQVLEKEEILSLYLNKIFLGHRAYGFGAAAEVYYGKPLSELSLAQTAMLAGLPKAPSSFNPIRNPERAVIRRNYVLRRMADLEWITAEEYDIAKQESVTAKKHSRDTGLDAPHIAEMVRAQLIDQFGENAYWQGLNVYTTIETDKQIKAAEALRQGLKAYDKRHGYRGAVTNVDLDAAVDGEIAGPEAYEDILSEFPDSREQTPALVISIVENEAGGEATVWSRDSDLARIRFEDAKWASSYIDANRKGPAPKNINEVLSRGDVVYIQPKASSADPQSQNQESKELTKDQETEDDLVTVDWELTQLPQVSGSIISLNPQTGSIISLVGGYDFFLNKYNRATQSIRQPGSNIKPFIYSASLEKGFTPSSLISGAPIVLTDPAHGTRWRPENYSGKFFGPTRMRVALSKSMNLVSIRLLRSIGIPFAREYVARFGLDMNRFSNSLTMALGSGGVKPIEMISAYSVLANGGYKVKPYFIERIVNREGETIFRAPKPVFCDECIEEHLAKPEILKEIEDLVAAQELEKEQASSIEDDTQQEETTEAEDPKPILIQEFPTYTAPRVMTQANNFLTVNMLKDVVTRGTARKALVLNRTDLAGKTGTTNDYVDAWFSGFNSQVVTTVWVGFDQPQSMGRGEAGSLAALPIWVDYMKVGLLDVPTDQTSFPTFAEPGYVNRITGERTDDEDPMAIDEIFINQRLTPEYTLLLNRLQRLIAEIDVAEYYQPTFDDTNDDLSYIGSLFADQMGVDSTRGLLDPELEEGMNEQGKERIIEDEEDTDGLF